jgi:hypothetical protein
MQELAIAQKRLEDPRHPALVKPKGSGISWAKRMPPWCSLVSAMSVPGIQHLKLASCSYSLTWLEPRCPSWRRLSITDWSGRAASWPRWWSST